MRKRRIFVVGCCVVVLGWAIVAIWSASTAPQPPVVTLANVEPSGVMDDNGVEMWQLTLSVSNLNSQSPNGGILYIKNDGRPTQARSGRQWVKLDQAWVEARLSKEFGTYEIYPGRNRENPILVPASTEACRIWLKYVGSKQSLKSRLATMVQKLPGFLQSRVPSRFWKWVGQERYYSNYQPKSDWREMKIELPIRSANEAHMA